LLTLLLLACGSGPEGSADPTVDYDAWGAFTPGALTLSTGGDPSLPVDVWFPAQEDDGPLHNYLLGLTSDAIDGTPDCAAPRPAVLFSHGSGGLRYQSMFLVEFLASHGYVVIAPDHLENTSFDEDETAYGRVALRRPVDLTRAWDAALADPRLADCLDPAAGFAVVGHSFGGWTALVLAGAPIDLTLTATVCGASRGWLCQLLDEPVSGLVDLSDDRVWASVPMAPSTADTLSATSIAAIDAPLAILGGTEDSLTPWETDQAALWPAVTASPAALVQVDGASHYTFSDSCRLLPIPEFCDSSIDLDRAQALVRSFTLAWLDKARGVEAADAWLPPTAPELDYTAR
jgi:predicted dienelactone hydrolase